VLSGGRGSDHLIGGGAGDVMDGKLGGDLLEGNYGSDYLFGGRGADLLRAGPGNDGCLNGVDHRANDSLIGGSGTDRYDADRGDALRSVETQTFKCLEGE
jgi:Ca2+-binding RTX toxin-like protein